MKKDPAIAALEFRDIAAGMLATDALLKKAPIGWIKSGTISRGRYLTLIGGTTASVEESHQEGVWSAGENMVDHLFLPDIHPDLYEGVQGKRTPCTKEAALGIVETDTVCGNLLAAERVLKGTPVHLVEIRLADPFLHGKGVSIFSGELHDIEAAMDLAVSFVQARGAHVVHRILTSPHDSMLDQINHSTTFVDARWLELQGE